MPGVTVHIFTIFDAIAIIINPITASCFFLRLARLAMAQKNNLICTIVDRVIVVIDAIFAVYP